jgi:hypothetical protein
MNQQVLAFATKISDGIPSAYHDRLETRLALAWTEQKRQVREQQRRPKSENTAIHRDNRARAFYLQVQDQNYLAFLPFVLAYSPRACIDLKPAELAQLKYGRDVVQANTETKELIEGIASRNGFSQNPNYLKFMRKMFSQGLLGLLYSLD